MEPARHGGQTAPASILLVDDRPGNLVALEAILESLGQRLVRATSGEQALSRLLHEEFALILLDVNMPGLDGFQVASLVRQRTAMRHIPIIFITAISTHSSAIFEGYEHGAVDYLVKPLDPHILRAKVSVFIDLHRKNKLIEQQQQRLLEREREALERESMHRFRLLIDSMAALVWTTDVDGEFRDANHRALSLCGAPGQFFVAVSQEDRARVERVWSEAIFTRQAFEVECRMGGSTAHRWYLVRGVPRIDDDCERSGWIIVATDIEDRKRAEDAMLLSQRELQRINQAKDEFLATASHELRSPLFAACTQTDLAMSQVGPDRGTFPGSAFVLVRRQLDRMIELIGDLLDVAKLQSGRLRLEPAEFDLTGLAAEVVERVEGTTTRHRLRLSASPGLLVFADRARLDQVMTNLVSNAVRYSPDGGDIEVELWSELDEVHLAVRDHGVGVPIDKQSSIFERFGRAHGSRYGGLGLGLAIAEGVVRQHHGRIWVESDGIPGNGSRFRVCIPSRLLTDEESVETDGVIAGHPTG